MSSCVRRGNRHLAFPAIRKTSDELDCCWLYLNHNCDPNGYINADELTFRALTDIAAGAEITFNYLTTESELAAPFTCTCGSTNCFGLIQGRDFLTPAEAERLSRVVDEDLSRIVAEDPSRVVDEDKAQRGKPAFLTARSFS